MVGRNRFTARLDVDMAAGKSAPRTNGIVRRAVWSAEIELESDGLQRVGLDGRYDRLGSDADLDAHSMGYGDNWG